MSKDKKTPRVRSEEIPPIGSPEYRRMVREFKCLYKQAAKAFVKSYAQLGKQ